MANNYEKFRENADEINASKEEMASAQELSSEVAYGKKEDLDAAHELLGEAADKNAQAEERFKAIISAGKKEVTPGLIAEAYGEYMGLLKKDAFGAIESEDFEKLSDLAAEMGKLYAQYGKEAGSISIELEEKVEELTKKNGVPEDRKYYNKRAYKMEKEGFSREDIEAILDREMKRHDKPVKMLDDKSKWVGNQRRRDAQ